MSVLPRLLWHEAIQHRDQFREPLLHSVFKKALAGFEPAFRSVFYPGLHIHLIRERVFVQLHHRAVNDMAAGNLSRFAFTALAGLLL